MLAFPNAAPMTGPKPAFWVYEWLHPQDGSVTLRSLRPEDHCRPPDRCIPVPLMDEWVAKMNAACKGTPAELYERLAAAHEASLDDDHRACRSILTECMRLLAAAPAAPAPWVPVSERLPGERTLCLVMLGEQMHVAQFDPLLRSAKWWNAYGLPSRLAQEPTHWMPLPAAPEASKGGGNASR